MSTTTQCVTYKFKDMSLAEWGRQEMKLADAEMLRKDQSDYIGVTVQGPFKPNSTDIKYRL